METTMENFIWKWHPGQSGPQPIEIAICQNEDRAAWRVNPHIGGGDSPEYIYGNTWTLPDTAYLESELDAIVARAQAILDAHGHPIGGEIPATVSAEIDYIIENSMSDVAIWEVGDWLYEYARNGIGLTTTDAELLAMAEECELNAMNEFVALRGDCLKYLMSVRNELIEA